MLGARAIAPKNGKLRLEANYSPYGTPKRLILSAQLGHLRWLMFSTSPSIGASIFLAIFTALDTIIEARSWGEDTTTTPSKGRDWNTVRGASLVPGGRSTRRK